MKTSLLAIRIFAVFVCILIYSDAYSKCGGFKAYCQKYYPQYSLLATSNRSWAPEIFVSVNPGDSIRIDLYGDPIDCSNLWFDTLWYFNDTIELTGVALAGGAYLKIAALPGVYEMIRGDTTKIHVSYVTSINENKLFNGLNIYPVPANNKLNISFISTKPADYTFTLSNVLGKIIKEYTLKNISGEIKQEEDLSQFTDGVYFLVIHSADIIETRKFLKITSGL